MTSENRIKNLESFVEGHRFLAGAEYRVVLDEKTDKIKVEFKKLDREQDYAWRASLKSHGMKHVETVIHKITEVKRKTAQNRSSKSGSYRKV